MRAERKASYKFRNCAGKEILHVVQITGTLVSLQSADWTQEVVTCAEEDVWYLRLCSLGGGDLSRRFGCGLASLRLETENREK